MLSYFLQRIWRYSMVIIISKNPKRLKFAYYGTKSPNFVQISGGFNRDVWVCSIPSDIGPLLWSVYTLWYWPAHPHMIRVHPLLMTVHLQKILSDSYYNTLTLSLTVLDSWKSFTIYIIWNVNNMNGCTLL